MGRKNKIKNTIPKNRDIEDIVYGTTQKQEKISVSVEKNDFKDSLKFKHFCMRKDSEIKEEEKRITLLRAMSKLQDEER